MWRRGRRPVTHTIAHKDHLLLLRCLRTVGVVIISNEPFIIIIVILILLIILLAVPTTASTTPTTTTTTTTASAATAIRTSTSIRTPSRCCLTMIIAMIGSIYAG